MKDLSIKGTVHTGSVDYKVLWSEIVKDFNKLPFWHSVSYDRAVGCGLRKFRRHKLIRHKKICRINRADEVSLLGSENIKLCSYQVS